MSKLTFFTIAIVWFCFLQSFSQAPKRTIISGKINHPEEKTACLYIARPGLTQIELHDRLDSLNQFVFSFEAYIPTDVNMGNSFDILVHPGDSIYVEYDDDITDKSLKIKSAKFSGDAAKLNQDAALFQALYYSNPPYTYMMSNHYQAMSYDLGKYQEYLDTIRQQGNDLYSSFITKNDITEELRNWILCKTENPYFYELMMYPAQMQFNPRKIDIPTEYYDGYLKGLPITRNKLICAGDLSSFINGYHYFYIYPKVMSKVNRSEYKDETGKVHFPIGMIDSLVIDGIFRFTNDSLLRQMVLSEKFNEILARQDIMIFEKYLNRLEAWITEPFLIQPLLNKYKKTKHFLEDPEDVTRILFEKMKQSSLAALQDSVFTNNKNKVIYIDCWSTWCGPCLLGIERSKELIKKMEGEDVEFVYLCLNSKEENWRLMINKKAIPGKNYFLTPTQSDDLSEIFEFSGVPYYILVDRNGIIVNKGGSGPETAAPEIAKLLKN